MAFTVQEEIDLIRSIGGYEDLDGDYTADAPSAPSSGTLIRLIDRANREAWEAWSASDEGWNTVRTTLVRSAPSSSFVDLPADFHRVRSVQFQVAPGLGFETLLRANASDDLLSVLGSGYPTAYREFPTQLEVLPLGSTADIRLTYCPQAARITSPTDTIPSTDGYDLYVAYWVLVRARQREEKDTSEFRSSLAQVQASFTEKVRRRDRGQAMRMRPRGTIGRWPLRTRNL
jgi:hypothetical protein